MPTSRVQIGATEPNEMGSLEAAHPEELAQQLFRQISLTLIRGFLAENTKMRFPPGLRPGPEGA